MFEDIVRVDPAVARDYGLRHPSGAIQIRGPHAVRQTVFRAVDELEAFFLVAKLHHVGDRPEYLFDCAAIVGLPGKKAGPNVETLVPTHLSFATSQNNLSPGTLPFLEVTYHTILLLLPDQPPHLRFGIETVANPRLFQVHLRGLDESFINAFLNNPPCSRAANLAAVQCDRTREQFSYALHVGVGKNDRRSLAPSSSLAGTRLRPQAAATSLPTSGEPVNDMRLMSGCAASAAPA